MKIKSIFKACFYGIGSMIGIIAFIDMIFDKSYLIISSNTWQLFGLSLVFLALANVDKIETFSFRFGENKEISFKIQDSTSQTGIEFKETKNNKEIYYYYTKNIPLKIWDLGGIQHDAVNDLITLLEKDSNTNEKQINYIRNLILLLENFRIKSIENYGTNSNGTFILFNEGQAACTGMLQFDSTNIDQVIFFPLAFSHIPTIRIINKKSYINIFNVSRLSFSISSEKKMLINTIILLMIKIKKSNNCCVPRTDGHF